MRREGFVAAVMFERLGRYHAARLSALNAVMDTVAVEVFERDSTYAWEIDPAAAPYERVTLFADENGARSEGGVAPAVWSALDRIGPSFVAIPGWSADYALSALGWCIGQGVPAVLMSDSTVYDAPRRWWSERVKRSVVGLCGAALVAGQRHREYMQSLGMAEERIVAGYDVVDNQHFASGGEAARRRTVEWRARFALPEQYFLASSRFVDKKNLFRLLDAFAAYRLRTGTHGWNLVVLGDGPLRDALERHIESLGLATCVKLAGFVGYEDLPTYYGLAGAFVHASTVEQWGLVVNEAMAAGLPVLVSDRCGCAPDLVNPGQNGFTFDPLNVVALADLMTEIAAMDVAARAAMSKASVKIIQRWTPVTFAEALQQAAHAAVRAPRRKAWWWDHILLQALARR